MQMIPMHLIRGVEAKKLIGVSALDMFEAADDEVMCCSILMHRYLNLEIVQLCSQTFKLYHRVACRIELTRLLCYFKRSSDVINKVTCTKYAVVACYPV
ncbi:uncharacterized protein [Coffea arabica]|uniref:Uncharacterized protein isoform X2 n=1 Tax=Coffea arabica TaxID=13443 RepID=A0A6P6VT23_COFAR|nr:uncharacterized protein LOC113719002 isoform X4 [Coffea arabica]XP_027099768.1 uncharacterized protein LOC113719002 isoform X4 [Coffea arabica]XP_027106209.1 uncharacterized protein LOC113726598 isoform X4 [Coffea arabica]XP_027106210.1 uncharacterized protein LOC113726598 isoform X4 [Coffea arabica]